jgi:hypothetical protein
MAFGKYLVPGVLLLSVLAPAARGAPMAAGVSWRWTTWAPGRGVIPLALSGPVHLPVPVPAFSPPPPSIVPVTPVPPATTFASVPPPAPLLAAPVAAAPRPDAYLNLGDGPYAEDDWLTVGNARPWYTSPVAARVFGGPPDAQERADFTAAILQRVQQTFSQSGLTVRLTTDPNAGAAHSLSVVSGTFYGEKPAAIGIAGMGGSGFSFIDKFGDVQTADQLQWAIAHNAAHELMHAFGGGHHDTTGAYLDSAATRWSLLIDPGATFSSESVRELLFRNANLGPIPGAVAGSELLSPCPAGHSLGCCCRGCQAGSMPMAPAPVPEPATCALWALGLAAATRLRNPGRPRKGADRGV